MQGLWQANNEILSIIFLKEFIKLNVNMDTMIKNAELVEIHTEHATVFLEYTSFGYDVIECKCLCSNRNYQQEFNEELQERFFNAYKFSNHDGNKLI